MTPQATAGEVLGVWRCETCKGELAMPAGYSEFAGYACCYAAMTYLGVRLKEPPPPAASPCSFEGEL